MIKIIFQSRYRSCEDLTCEDELSKREFTCRLIMMCVANLMI